MADPLISATRSQPVYAGLDPMFALLMCPGSVRTKDLSGNLTLNATYPSICKLDPGGSSRDITLDAVASASGAHRILINAADAAENLVAKNEGGTTIGTVNQNEAGWFYCDGTAWNVVAIVTIALS